MSRQDISTSRAIFFTRIQRKRVTRSQRQYPHGECWIDMTYRNLTLVSKVGNGMATRARNLSSLITREGIHEGESCSLWKYLM